MRSYLFLLPAYFNISGNIECSLSLSLSQDVRQTRTSHWNLSRVIAVSSIYWLGSVQISRQDGVLIIKRLSRAPIPSCTINNTIFLFGRVSSQKYTIFALSWRESVAYLRRMN